MRDVMTKCCEIVFRVKILWTHQLMVAGRVMLGVIIGFHFASFVPINMELSLCGSVAYPMEAHVHWASDSGDYSILLDEN